MLPGNKNVQKFLRESAGKPSKFGVVQSAALGLSCIAPQSLRSRSFELKNGVVHVGAFSVLMKDSCTIAIFGKNCHFCCLAPLLVSAGVRTPAGGVRRCPQVSARPPEVSAGVRRCPHARRRCLQLSAGVRTPGGGVRRCPHVSTRPLKVSVGVRGCK